jgi:hypothetical protein
MIVGLSVQLEIDNHSEGIVFYWSNGYFFAIIGLSMQNYVIKDYQQGVESDQARIGIEVAKNWIWPFAYDLEDLLKIHAQPEFDPDTRHYCFLGDEMVGYMVSQINPAKEGEPASAAQLDFPRMLPGHEQAAGMLMERAMETLTRKGVSRVVGRVSSMCPEDIRLAEKVGFSVRDWGYKVYYSYEMREGKLNVYDDSAEEIDPRISLNECARIAARWYKRPPEWCHSHLQEWHQSGNIISHLGVREKGKIVASCMTAPNVLRPSTAAIYYIYTPDENHLYPMLARVVSKCIDFGVDNVIADLINDHRQYEPIYQKLCFKKVAEWARCEKSLP